MFKRLLFVLMVALAGVALIWTGVRGQRENADLAQRGIEAPADIVSLTTSKKRKGGRKHRVTVRFTDQRGVVNEIQSGVDRKTLDSLTSGGKTSVRYLPEDPAILRVAGYQTSPGIFVVSGLVVLALALLLAWWLLVKKVPLRTVRTR